MALTLTPTEVIGPTRWRWLLTDGAGRAVADHAVDLDANSLEYGAFGNLYGAVRMYRIPDDTTNSEAELVDRVGRWIGRHVLGDAIGRALDGTVVVKLPPEAEFLLDRPLELGHVDGRPLALSGVTMVYELGDGAWLPKEPVGDSLRMLALFSLPFGTPALALRRERYELARTVRRLGARSGRAVELRVLQYGVTRQRLANTIEEHPGWDLLHISGHGEAGVLVLESSEGAVDAVSTEDLVSMLAPAGPRLKLAVLSVCRSGAQEAADALRILNLYKAADAVEARQSPPAWAFDDAALSMQLSAPPALRPGGQLASLARGLVDRLGTPVIAMRYPVADSFAVALSGELYPSLFESAQPVDRALAFALPRATGSAPSPERPAVSVATPALFGAAAVGLALVPPVGRVDTDPWGVLMAGFPPEPERFVGRTQTLMEANAALAPRSGRTGVLFTGMPGAGKTTCALELAYQHRQQFAGYLWWQAPTRGDGDEMADALVGLAQAVEQQLGIAMLDAVGSEATLRRFLPRLAAVLREQAVLLVLDNVEGLLVDGGTWRDPLWEPLMESLTGHGGLSRVVLAGRVIWPGLDPVRLLVQPVHSLSIAESVLMAQELPNLHRLLYADLGAEHKGTPVRADRDMVRQVLHIARGHPKLLEVADGVAADPAVLRRRLDAAQAADLDATAGAFFAPDSDAGAFRVVLSRWASDTTRGLPQPASTLVRLLAHISDDDRTSWVVRKAWGSLWDQAGPGGADPMREATDVLRSTGLADPVPTEPRGADADSYFCLHPTIAEAVRADAPGGFQADVDQVLAGMWMDLYADAANGEDAGQETSWDIVQIALSAVPYLVRLGRTPDAVVLLARAIERDEAPAVAKRVLAHLQRLVEEELDAVHRLTTEAVLASVLVRVEPIEGLTRLRRVAEEATARGNDYLVAAVYGCLAASYERAGDAVAAADTADRLIQAAAAWGPWSVATAEAARLRALNAMGEHRAALAEAMALLDRLDTLPPDIEARSLVPPWSVRETVLDTARSAALALADWSRAMEVNERVADSARRRGAPVYELARILVNDAGPMLRLDRHDDAERLLAQCQQIFEDAGDSGALGVVFGARADLEARRGRADEAVALDRVALRYSYKRPEPDDLAAGHANLANHLRGAGQQPAEVAAHLAAAALINEAAGRNIAALRIVLQFGPFVDDLPDHVDEVVRRAETTPGVGLGRVLQLLLPDANARVALYAGLVDAAFPVDNRRS